MLIIWSVKVFASQLLSTSSEVLKVKPPLVEITLAHDYPAQVVGTESETSTGRNYTST